MDLASLVAVSVVTVACSMLSLLLASLCWQQYEGSRPSHTYCARCLYGEAREQEVNQRLGMGMGNAGEAGLGNLDLLEVPHTQTLDLGPGDQPPLFDPAHLDLEASTLSRSFHRPRGNSRATAVGEEVLVQFEEPLLPSEESKLSEVRLLMPPPVEGGQQQPLTTTPANSRACRTSSRRRVPASLPPVPPPGETTDEEVVGARAKIPLARAATVTAGTRQVPLKLLRGRSRHWSDPKALRKKGSPGRTATAVFMAGQSLGNKLNVDINFGEESQLAVAARVLTSSQLQAPQPYRPGYSESEATSDDSCYKPRPPSSFRLSPSLHPEVFSETSSRPSSRPSRPSSLAWDNYESGPHFQPPAAIHHQ